jgi:4-aminobutyrate aminotransferase-like enzyme
MGINMEVFRTEVRGCGLMAALELDGEQDGLGARLHRFLLEKGIILDYQPHSQTFRLFPPYIIGEEEIDAALAVLEEGLSRLRV